MNTQDIESIKVGNLDIAKIMHKGGVIWEKPKIENFYMSYTRDVILDNYYYSFYKGTISKTHNDSFCCIEPILLPKKLNYDSLNFSYRRGYVEDNFDLVKFVSVDTTKVVYVTIRDYENRTKMNEIKNKLKLEPRWYFYAEVYKSSSPIQNIIDADIRIFINAK